MLLAYAAVHLFAVLVAAVFPSFSWPSHNSLDINGLNATDIHFETFAVFTAHTLPMIILW